MSFQLSCAGGLSWARTLVGDLIETDHNVAGQVVERETGARGQGTGRTRTGKDRQYGRNTWTGKANEKESYKADRTGTLK